MDSLQFEARGKLSGGKVREWVWVWVESFGVMPNKRLQPTIASVTPCAGAQAAPATLAAEANVIRTDRLGNMSTHAIWHWEITVRHEVQVVLLALVASLLVHATAAASAPTIGEPAPNLKEAVWLKGSPLLDFEPNRIYVVDLWATWCKPCLKSMPALHDLESQYKDNVTFIALSIWDPERDRVSEFIKEHGEIMPGLIATDSISPGKEFNEGILAVRFLGTSERVSVPRTYIVDRTGKLVWVGEPWDLEVPLEQVVNGTWDWANFAASWEDGLDKKVSEESSAN